MKKTFKKIVLCLVAIGVVFFTTPFLIKTRADSTDIYYQINKREFNDIYTFNDGAFLDINIYFYISPSTDKIKIVVYFLSTSSHLEDYSDASITLYRGRDSEIYTNETSVINVGSGVYEGLSDGFSLTIEYSSSINHYFYAYIRYQNVEDDNDINFNRYLYFGNPSETYTLDSYFYQQGQTETIVNTSASSWISNIGQGVSNILTIPVFGTITIGTLVFIPIAMSVLLWLLHVWRRN